MCCWLDAPDHEAKDHLSAGWPLSDAPALVTLAQSIQVDTWSDSAEIGNQLRRRLGRNTQGAAKSLVLGGDSSTSAQRRQFVDKVAQWVQPRSRCPESSLDGWLIEVDGSDMYPAAEKILVDIGRQKCAITMVVVREAHRADSSALHILEPLLSGERSKVHTDVMLLFDAEISAADQCSGGSGHFSCAQESLQKWIATNIWKRSGFVGRITMFIPF